MADAFCPSCKKKIAPVWAKCLHCGAELPVTDAVLEAREKAKQAVAEQTLKSFEKNIKQELSKKDKLINVALFVLSTPFLVPSLIFTAINVKRWGRITGVHLTFDIIIINAVAYSLKAHWNKGGIIPATISVIPSAVLIGTIATIILWMRRAQAGQGASGMLLGYSGMVVFGLIVGALFTIIPLLIIFDGSAGGKTFFTLVVGVALLACTIFQVTEES